MTPGIRPKRIGRAKKFTENAWAQPKAALKTCASSKNAMLKDSFSAAG
ncbi:MAG: hypothetical protein ING26_06400 [Roseomonas sp.]|jgi:hypothetical protein|nr:hypothetical protein [Roseomonas sp.]